MYEKSHNHNLPQTVDEVADLLISDLPPREMNTLSDMSENEFFRLYNSVANYVLDEFKIWTGNDELLASCLNQVTGETRSSEADPAMIILRRVWQKLNDFPEIVIIA